MKLNKEVSQAKRKVLDTYPNAVIYTYSAGDALGTRYTVFVPSTRSENGFWLETNPESSRTKSMAGCSQIHSS